MSKIAREISKKVSVVALATALAVQAVPVNAVELEEKNDAQVVETTEEKAEAAETKVEEAAPVVEKEESIKESPKDTSRYNNYYDDNNDDDEIINIPDKVLEYNLEEYVSFLGAKSGKDLDILFPLPSNTKPCDKTVL